MVKPNRQYNINVRAVDYNKEHEVLGQYVL